MVTIDDPVIGAAATWLQTSLHLGEQAQVASDADRREGATPDGQTMAFALRAAALGIAVSEELLDNDATVVTW